jgi:hypothetical protein
MNTMKPTFGLLVLFFSSINYPVFANDLDDTIKLIREGQAKLDSYEREYQAIEVLRESTIHGKIEKSLYSVYHCDQSTLLKWDSKIYCSNPSDSFCVEKNPATGLFALTIHDKNRPDLTFSKMVVANNHLMLHPLTSAVQSKYVLDVFKQDGFQAESVSRDGQDAVTLSYSRPLSKIGNSERREKGAFTFSVSNNYLLTKYDYSIQNTTGPDGGIFRVTMTRKFTVKDGRPLVTEAKQEIKSSPAAPTDNTFLFKYSYPAKGLSSNEFQLGHYLPNDISTLEVYEEQTSQTWMLWAAVGVGCIFASLGLFWYMRRNKH